MQDQTEKRELITGVFSSQEVRKVGTGTTSRKTIQKAYWYCNEMADGQIEVQPLNVNYIPSGPKKKISKEQFLQSFAPEPELYVSNVFPQMREISKTIARGDRYRANKETFSAEMEYKTALKVDEENVRANFGLGITYIERGEAAKADNIFDRLVKLDAAFEAEHKHLFNEFGIHLRKSGMLDQALTYYQRAVELSPFDENLMVNVARAYLEKKDLENSLDYLLRALSLNSASEMAVKFLVWFVTNNMVPEGKKPEVAAMLQTIKSGGLAQASATKNSLDDATTAPFAGVSPPSEKA